MLPPAQMLLLLHSPYYSKKYILLNWKYIYNNFQAEKIKVNIFLNEKLIYEY